MAQPHDDLRRRILTALSAPDLYGSLERLMTELDQELEIVVADKPIMTDTERRQMALWLKTRGELLQQVTDALLADDQR